MSLLSSVYLVCTIISVRVLWSHLLTVTHRVHIALTFKRLLICGPMANLTLFNLSILLLSHFSPHICVDVPPAGPTDLPLSLLEMGCSGRFELITHPVPGQPLPPQSTVSHYYDSTCTHLIGTPDRKCLNFLQYYATSPPNVEW